VIRVLVADDEAVVRASLRTILSTAPDIEVVAEAADGRHAVTVRGGPPRRRALAALVRRRPADFVAEAAQGV
jgi:CheY-like chemotaxis protein